MTTEATQVEIVEELNGWATVHAAVPDPGSGGGHGELHITHFYGGADARKRAVEYAEWKYGHKETL